jgi:hypothetical protein
MAKLFLIFAQSIPSCPMTKYLHIIPTKSGVNAMIPIFGDFRLI